MFGIKDGFDIVIGNPPYGIKLKPQEKTILDKEFVNLTSSVKNSAIYFIYKTNKFLLSNGVNSFIIPKSICYSDGWNKCANFIMKEITHIIDTGKAFENVLLEQVAYVLRKGLLEKKYNNGLYNPEKNEIRIIGSLNKNIFYKYGVILAGQSESEVMLIKNILSRFNTQFGDIVNIERGLNWQKYISEYPGNTPVYRGSQLNKYYLDEATDFIDLNSFSLSDYEYQKKPKILNQLAIAHVQKPYPHFYLQSCLDLNNKIVFETISCTFITNKYVDIYLILMLNNSKVFAWLLYKFVFSNAIRSSRYDHKYITKLPIPNLEKIYLKKLKRIIHKLESLGDRNNQTFELLLNFFDLLSNKIYRLSYKECKIIDPEFDSVLAQFGISKEDYERMSVEELAELEAE